MAPVRTERRHLSGGDACRRRSDVGLGPISKAQAEERDKGQVRGRRDAEESRNLILDAVERLMQREGYGAVNTRSVAREAGMKPPLVHYHFETTENLLLAAYRRSVAVSQGKLRDALAADRPLRAIWQYHSDAARTALATQYMALAGQHVGIRNEMARNVEASRQVQIDLIEKVLERWPEGTLAPSAAAMAMAVAAAGRALVMEQTVGVTMAHADFVAELERLFDVIEPARAGGPDQVQ